jgi:hypothetical protein
MVSCCEKYGISCALADEHGASSPARRGDIAKMMSSSTIGMRGGKIEPRHRGLSRVRLRGEKYEYTVTVRRRDLVRYLCY